MVSINDKPDDSSIQGFIQSPDFAKKFAGLERSMHKLESEGPEDFLHSLSMSLIAKMIVCIDSKELNGEFAASCFAQVALFRMLAKRYGVKLPDPPTAKPKG